MATEREISLVKQAFATRRIPTHEKAAAAPAQPVGVIKVSGVSAPAPKQKPVGQRAAKQTQTSEEVSKPEVINDPLEAGEPAKAAPHAEIEPEKAVSPAEYKDKNDSELKIASIIKLAQGDEDEEKQQATKKPQQPAEPPAGQGDDWRFGSETAEGPMGYLGGRTLQSVAELANALGFGQYAPRIGEWAKDPTISQLTGTGVTALGALGGGYLLKKLLGRGKDESGLGDYDLDYDPKYASAPSETMEKINAALSGMPAEPLAASTDKYPWLRRGDGSIHRGQTQRRTEAFFTDPKVRAGAEG